MAASYPPTSGSSCPEARGNRGFTLIELMVVITIVAIGAALAGPAYDWLFRSYRVKNAATELQMSFMLARTEAIKRNASVVLQPTNADGTWQGGWSVMAGTTTVQNTAAYSNVTFSGVTGSISFSPVGRPNVAALLTVSDSASNTERRCVTLTNTGRVNVAAGGC